LADWRAIEATSRTLKDLLQRSLDAAIPGAATVRIVSPVVFDQLSNPDPKLLVSLFLFRVEENREIRNAPPRPASNGQLRRPLGVDLYYLVNAWGSRPQGGSPLTPAAEEDAVLEEHRLLGVVMQALAAHGEIGPTELVEEDPANPVWDADDSIQLIFDAIPVAEQQQIWDATDLAYRLGMTFRARIVGIDTLRPLAPPVSSAGFRYGEGRP
jgi:hypothetical protein